VENKVGKGSGENDGKNGDVLSHQESTTKIPMLLSQTLLGND
jgi:hypothetical protein